MSFVLENQDKELNWYALSQNPNITMDIIKENLELPWDWGCISRNPNITIDFIKEYPENLGIGFGYLIVQI